MFSPKTGVHKKPKIPKVSTISEISDSGNSASEQSSASVLTSVEPKKIGFWPQVALIFFTVSGGAYGLEAMVGAVGPRWTLLLVLLVPIFWAVPISLMAAELGSAIPEVGGYYVWVRRGLGKFWGFQEGWWTLCYSMVDLALYPVLFVTYLSFFFPTMLSANTHSGQITKWGVCSLFIFLSLLLNLRGIRRVGFNSIANLFIVSFPFVVLAIIGLFRGDWSLLNQAIHTGPPDGSNFPKLAAGLSIVLWNYSGWDNTSTYAEEIENPQRNYPRTLAVSMIIIIASYVLPLLAGFKATISPADWSEGSGWPAIAAKLGGPWLGTIGAIAALLSAWSLFNVQLLYVSRLPVAMARDGWLPERLTRRSPQSGAPTFVLVLLAVASALFASLSLEKLMVVDILFYSLGLSLEFAALIRLRQIEPDLLRPFKIPLGQFGLLLMSLPALATALTVAVFSVKGEGGSFFQLGIVLLGIASGIIMYAIQMRRTRPAIKPNSN